MLNSPDKALFVAGYDGQIVGLVLMQLVTNPEDPIFKPRRYAYVDELAVASQFWGRGIGRQLMAELYKWAQSQGLKDIELDVWESNEGAIRFYENLGYQPLRRKMILLLESQ